MPEATVLYSVTAVVIAALVIWVAVVLKVAKTPWARRAPAPVPSPDVELEPLGRTDADTMQEMPTLSMEGTTSPDAVDTAKATPVALSQRHLPASRSDDSKS